MGDVVLFTETASPGMFDMTINGRAGEYDVKTDEFDQALRRRRVRMDSQTEIWVQYESGHRVKITGRR